MSDTARFAPLLTAFREIVANDGGRGAGIAVVRDGRILVDCREGWADLARTRALTDTTLAPIFSTGKVAVATMIARLIDRGLLRLDQPVSSIWPAFAAAGKGAITVGDLMAHRAGLATLPDPLEAETWYDRTAICARLAAMPPLWPPGTASGYHPVTFGPLADTLHRLTDGRGIVDAFRQDIGEPLALDLWLGVPPHEQHRIADTEADGAPTVFGDLSPLRTLAFMRPSSSPGGRSLDEWRSADLPGVNGHGTALALARLMSALATDGTLDGAPILSETTIAAVSAERGFGDDLVLPHRLSWGAGFIRNRGFGGYGPSPDGFGHSGWGGSCAFADRANRLAFAYVPTLHSGSLIDDARARRLVDILYVCL